MNAKSYIFSCEFFCKKFFARFFAVAIGGGEGSFYQSIGNGTYGSVARCYMPPDFCNPQVDSQIAALFPSPNVVCYRIFAIIKPPFLRRPKIFFGFAFSV